MYICWLDIQGDQEKSNAVSLSYGFWITIVNIPENQATNCGYIIYLRSKIRTAWSRGRFSFSTQMLMSFIAEVERKLMANGSHKVIDKSPRTCSWPLLMASRKPWSSLDLLTSTFLSLMQASRHQVNLWHGSTEMTSWTSLSWRAINNSDLRVQ